MSTIFRGPVATQLFRLASLKSQLKLEGLGMKSSGGPIRPRIAQEFGLKPTAHRWEFIAAIDAKRAELEAQLQPGDISE
jgi:hypothetical protein